MKVHGILKRSPVILLDSLAVENITDKAKKKANKLLYKRLQVLRASSTRLINASEVLKQEIQTLEGQNKDVVKEQQQYLTLLKKRVQ